MPIYTYECENCGERFEARQGFNDSPLTICPTCEGKLYRVIQPVGIVFKGSGFYVNDSKGKNTLATSGTRKLDDDSKSSESTAASSTTSTTTTEGSGAAPAKSADTSTSTSTTPAVTKTKTE